MSIDKILEIASVHLGKAGDGSVVKPYQTPDRADPSLLVPIPRELNRTAYKITDEIFTGYDSWNCYETSFLLNNGYPVSGVLVIEYLSNSECIVESKSLKLYLNSYNMMRMGYSIDEAISQFTDCVEYDLNRALNTHVSVSFVQNSQKPCVVPLYNVDFLSIDDLVDVSSLQFDTYNEDPSLIKAVESSTDTVQRLHTSALRSNCRVTNQPDWGDVYIHIRGKRLVDPGSLLQYIVSMRQENHFHEEICEMMYARLFEILEPAELFVACNYTRRGGIDINPVRASDTVTLSLANSCMYTGVYAKTMRQ